MERGIDTYRPDRFFAIAFALSWFPWFAAAWFSSHSGLEAYQYGCLLIGGFGPFIAALLMMRGSDALKRDFSERLIDLRRFNPPFLLVTFLLMPVVTWIAVRISISFGQSPAQLTVSPHILARVPITFIAPTLEELGWRGYGMDSLRARMSMRKASVVFGILWAVWHWPLFLIAGSYQNELLANPLYAANFFLSVLPIAVIANWLYYKHQRLVVAAILFHFMLDAVPQGLAIGQVSKIIETVIFAVLAILILVLDKQAFRGRHVDTFALRPH